jgi:UDP-GlcNAc:undecaprenyl-phosphate/decaprenyl-phosphate GlcNAc-1-phosphate transferase
MNGLTCGLGIIIASLLWILAIPAWNIAEFPAFALPALVGAMLGFLCYNYPRAHAFLGDSGSHIVGYIAATTSILLFNAAWQQIQNENWATPWLAFYPLLLILAVPLYDLATTMSIRVWHGKPVYIGDTNHTSHRLVRYGLKPAVAVALLWVAAAITGLLGVLDSDNMLCRLY